MRDNFVSIRDVQRGYKMSYDDDRYQEMERIKKDIIETECKQGIHTWRHFYDFARCSTCGEEMDITTVNEHRNDN